LNFPRDNVRRLLEAVAIEIPAALPHRSRLDSHEAKIPTTTEVK
jgi:hypothetical protein